MKIDLIPTYFGPVLYEIYLDGHWIGSRRTVEQCWEYVQQFGGIFFPDARLA